MDTNLDKPNRRSIVKLIAASIAAVPLISSCRRTEAPEEDSKVSKPTLSLCSPKGITRPHEPPIGIYGGSLVIDVPKSHQFGVGVQAEDPRPYKHRFGSLDYLGIEEVRVFSRPRDHHPVYASYRLPQDTKYQLRIWLVHLKQDAGQEQTEYEPENIQTEPQFLLKVKPSWIETTKELRYVGYSHKKSIPLRYDFPPPNPPLDPPHRNHFHIARWRITDSAGNVVSDAEGNRFEGFGGDSYEISVSFHHTHA